MIFRLRNVDSDDFVANLLEELEYEIRNSENKSFRLESVEKTGEQTKGININELAVQIITWYSDYKPAVDNIIQGLIAAGLYDILKNTLKSFNKIPEYTPEKRIEIIEEDDDGHKHRVIITMEDILEKDK